MDILSLVTGGLLSDNESSSTDSIAYLQPVNISGTQNGVNTVFTTLDVDNISANFGLQGDIMVFVNGQLQTPVTDFTYIGVELTFVVPPLETDTISMRAVQIESEDARWLRLGDVVATNETGQLATTTLAAITSNGVSSMLLLRKPAASRVLKMERSEIKTAFNCNYKILVTQGSAAPTYIFESGELEANVTKIIEFTKPVIVYGGYGGVEIVLTNADGTGTITYFSYGFEKYA